MKRIIIMSWLMLVTSVVWAGQYTTTKNKACPDAWALTDKAIPVIYPSTEESKSPWGVAPSTDKAQAQSHIDAVNPVQTIDGTELTQEHDRDDLLTIASECLVLRNFEVDGPQSAVPTVVEQNTATGWVPAAIF